MKNIINDLMGGFKGSKGAKISLGVAIVALLAIFGLSGTETGNSDVVDLVTGSNPSENDFDAGEQSSGLFSGLTEATCDEDTYNCADFTIQSEAQELYERCGGRDNDVHSLDRDLDGKACVGLPQGT